MSVCGPALSRQASSIVCPINQIHGLLVVQTTLDSQLVTVTLGWDRVVGSCPNASDVRCQHETHFGFIIGKNQKPTRMNVQH